MIYKKPRLSDRQRKIAEERERIFETGQDSELRGAKVTGQIFKQVQLEEARQRDDFLTLLKTRQHRNDYNEQLSKILVIYLKEEDLDRNIATRVQWDTKGVVMHLQIRGRIFRRAFRSVRDPAIDLNACKMFAISASALVTKLKENGPAIIKH